MPKIENGLEKNKIKGKFDVHTKGITSLARIAAEPDQGLVGEDAVALERLPDAGEGAVAGEVRDHAALREPLLERPVGPDESEIQLYIHT